MAIISKLRNIYTVLPEKQKQEIKRTYAGVGSQVVREGIELYRMLDKPTKTEEEATEKFLKELYSKTVGEENVGTTQRGDKEVTTILEPESTAAKVTRDIGSFAVTMAGIGKVTKPLQAFKAVQKTQKVAPKTTSLLGLVARGETATQLSINPYEENLANVLGNLIDEDNVGIASDIEKYLLEPIKSSQEKTELENRIGLLSTGIALTGAFGVTASAITNRKDISNNLINSLKNIKEKGSNVSEAFVNKVKRIKRQDKDVIVEAKELRKKDFQGQGDIEALNEGLTKKFSSVPVVRNLSNALAKTFTTRGGRSKLLHENYLKTKNVNERWDATIDHTGRNLQEAITNIHKAVGGNKEKIIDDINKLLFTDFRTPTIVTKKGTSVGRSQDATFKKEINKLPEAARQPIIKARELQDKLSKLLLDSESVVKADKKIIQDQLGFYVRESYKIFEDAGYTASIKASQEARKYIKKDIIKRNSDVNGNLKITQSKLRLETQSQMEQLAGGKGQYTSFSSAYENFNKIKGGLLVSKVDIPPAIKSYMGEINDPVEKLLISMKKISSFVEESKFHNQAYLDGKDIYFHKSKTAVPGFDVEIPFIKGAKVQPYGELSGKYTSKDLASYYTKRYEQGLILDADTSGITSVGTDIWRGLLFLKSQAQKSKTVRRLGTHVKNIFGGGQITGANGFSMFSNKGISKSFKAIQSQLSKSNDLEKQEFIEKLSGYGILNKNAVINDLKNLANEASQINYNPFSKPAKYLKETKIVKKILAADEKATDYYIAEDDFWKINMWISEQDNLNSFNKALPKDSKFDAFRITDVEQEAANLTRNGLPNYDLVPENIQKLRGIPLIGNFFSFLSESFRLSVTIPRQSFKELSTARALSKEGAKEASSIIRNRGLDRAAGFTTFGLGGGYAATEIANYATGVSQDTIENIKPFLPKWMQTDNVVYSVNEEGTPIVYNVTPWDAFDFPRKPFQTAFNIATSRDLSEKEEKQMVYDVFTSSLTPFFGESLTQEVISDYVFRGGRDINGNFIKNPYNKLERFDDTGDSWFENATNGENLKILAMNLVETVEPGTLTDFRKYAKTWGKETSELDQTLYPKQAMVKFLTGFGGMPMNKEYVENLYSFKIKDFKTKKSKRISNIYAGIKDDITPKEFINNVTKIQRKYYEDYVEIHTLSEAAENLKLPTLKILKDSGISEGDRVSFLGNTKYFNPLQITDVMKNNILESTSLKKDYFNIILEIDRQNKILMQLPVLINTNTKKEFLKEEEIDNIFKDLRIPKSTGGIVKGKDDVPYTKENPANRVNKYTGKPYSESSDVTEQLTKLGLNK